MKERENQKGKSGFRCIDIYDPSGTVLSHLQPAVCVSPFLCPPRLPTAIMALVKRSSSAVTSSEAVDDHPVADAEFASHFLEMG